MKRIIFLLSFVCFFVFNSNAQFKIGLEGGLNYSTSEFSRSDLFTRKYQPYYFIGISPRLHFGEKLTFLTDLEYSLKGYKYETISSGDVKIRYDYITLIPQIELRLIEALGVSFGVNIALKAGEAQKLNEEGWESTNDINTIDSFDFGFTGALRLYLGDLYLKFAYDHSLNDISNIIYTDMNGNLIGTVEQYNRNFQFGVGYLLF